MEQITDSASALAYTRGVQNAFNLIMSLGITSHMWMPESYVTETQNVLDGAEYDYIVVGAGTAGAIVAARLAHSTAKVLLIEAGGDPPIETIYPSLALYTRSSLIDYNFTLTNGRQTKYTLGAGKVLGGTSTINIMVYERGNRRDYNNWVTASKNQIWSLDYTLNYFKRTEKLKDPSILNSPCKANHGLNGPLIVTKEKRREQIDKYVDAYRELGSKFILDLNCNETLGFAPTQYTIGHVRQSSATAFLKASDKTPYLHLLKNTEVTKILFDANNNAIGVEATRNGKKITFKARKEVIISAGVINTPKLLMLSGIGPKKHLDSLNIKTITNLPVGENYHDHISVLLVHTLGRVYGPEPDVDLRKYPFPMMTRLEALNKSRQYPDYVVSGYFLLTNFASRGALQDTSLNNRYTSSIRDRIFKQTIRQKQLFSFIKNTIPKSRGRVLLRSSDTKDQPIIDAGFYSNKADLEDHVDYVQDYFKIGNTKTFKDIGAKFVNPLDKECAGYKFGSREYWKCYIWYMMYPSGHAVGTCAMGTVVDSRLRVFGVKRLRVVDASVIPVITSVGTYAATMMIGEKAASVILEQKYY